MKIKTNEIFLLKTQHNLGIDILRFLLCVSVVATHCGFSGINKITYIIMGGFQWHHVSTFCLLSFYLTSKYYYNFDWNIFRKRIYRLVYPMITWSIIYWIFLLLSDYFFNTNWAGGICGLIWQLITGHNFNSVLWFHIDIIYLTVIFAIISRYISKKNQFYIILFFFICIGYVFQYTGLNYRLFGNYRYELKYPLGRFFEMLPIACVGMLLPHLNDNLLMMVKKRWYLFVILILFIFFLSYLLREIKMPYYNFGYSGIQSLIISVLRLYTFLVFPVFFLHQKIQFLLQLITNYTMGIYCMHILVKGFIKLMFKRLDFSFQNEKILLILITYLSCWLLCHLMHLTKNKYLNDLVVKNYILYVAF